MDSDVGFKENKSHLLQADKMVLRRYLAGNKYTEIYFSVFQGNHKPFPHILWKLFLLRADGVDTLLASTFSLPPAPRQNLGRLPCKTLITLFSPRNKWEKLHLVS